MSSYDNPTIVLVSIGYGGYTLHHAPAERATCRTEGSGDGWTKYLSTPDGDAFIPAGTPVVDCRVFGCDTVGWAVKGPMFDPTLAANEVSEFLAGVTKWNGERLSGMAKCGIDVYLAHARDYGCAITDAATGEPLPVPDAEIHGKADARNNAIAVGVATNPAETVAAVMMSHLCDEA